MWHFTPYDENRRRILAPLIVEQVLAQPDGGFVLRVHGSVFRPQGAAWIYGTDLVFARRAGELLYRHAVRRFSFNFGYGRYEEEGSEKPNSGIDGRVAVEDSREEDGRVVLIRKEFDGVLLEEPSAACGYDQLQIANDYPHGTFEELQAIARCITEWPGTQIRRRTPDQPTLLEHGWTREGEVVMVHAEILAYEMAAAEDLFEDGSCKVYDMTVMKVLSPAEYAGSSVAESRPAPLNVHD